MCAKSIKSKTSKTDQKSATKKPENTDDKHKNNQPEPVKTDQKSLNKKAETEESENTEQTKPETKEPSEASSVVILETMRISQEPVEAIDKGAAVDGEDATEMPEDTEADLAENEELEGDEEAVSEDDATEAENDNAGVSEDDTAETDAEIDRIIPEPEEGKKRHSKVWIWCLIAVLALALVVAGGFAIAQIWQSDEQNSETTEPAEPEDVPDEDSDEEEEPEAPAEEPEPEVPAESEKPAVEDPMPPIAERPATDDDPDVTPGSKLIALTFDDGPSPANTPRLLDILKGRNAKATFFVLGNLAQRNPGIIQREAAEGHEVASHTPYHTQQTTLSAAQVRAEALQMDQIFTDILGTVPPFTRPPYGSYNDMVRSAMAQPLILWSIDPRDWADRDANIVCSRVTSAAFDGAIILVHDIHATTVDAVPCIIDNLRAQGYQFLTVSELAAAKDVPLVSGGVYGSFR